MRNGILATLAHARVDLDEAIAAVEAGDVDRALAKLEEISERLRQKAAELRA